MSTWNDFANDSHLQTRTYFRKSEFAREINIFNGKKTKHIPAIVDLEVYQVTTNKLSTNV